MTRIFTLILALFSILTLHAQHEWTRTNPGGGGAIAVVGATVTGTIIVASDLSGIYRSTDDGQSFDALGANNGLLETHISALGFDPNNGDVFFAGGYNGVYKTTDGGEHFNFVFPGSNNAFDYSYIEDIAIAASNSNIGYVTHHLSTETPGDVYKTVDGGDTWNAIAGEDLPDNLRLVKLMVHPTDENIVYALSGKSRWGCGPAQLYRSIDGGVQWNMIGANEGDILDFDLHPTDPNTIYISTFLSTYQDNASCIEMGFENYVVDDELGGEFYKSIDGGSSFTQLSDKTGIISVGIEDPNVIRLVDILFPYDWNSNAGTWETSDGGASWDHSGFVENWNTGFSENQYFSFVGSFNGLNKTVTKDLFNSDRYYGSFGQWAWASFDGAEHLNNISTKEISPDHWLSTGVENIEGHCLEVHDANPNIIYMGGFDIGFWYSTDHGASWSHGQPNYNMYPEYSWNVGEPGTVDQSMAEHGAGSNIHTIISDPTRENVVWASFSKEQLSDPIENSIAHTGLFKSVDNGANWVLLDNGLPNFDQSIRMYGLSINAQSPVDNRTMFITVDGDVYRSQNDGDSWEMVLQNGGLKFTEVDHFIGSIVYAGGKNGLWQSVDNGDNWNEIGLPEMHNFNANIRPDIVPTWTDWTDNDNPTYAWEGVFDIQTDPNNPYIVYVAVYGPEGGIYKSIDAGISWSENLLPDTDLRGIAISPANSNILYATSSMSYHSGGYGNSLGILYSIDAGATWEDANDGMSYSYGGRIEVEHGNTPYVWAWSPGTGVQNALVPYFTGISDIKAPLNLTVYPNPSQDEIFLQWDDMQKEAFLLKVFNVSGEVIFSRSVPAGLSTANISMENWANGEYIVVVDTSAGTFSYKISKE